MRFVRLLPFLVLLLDACVERVDVEEVIITPGLVVDGLITDRPGPHVVRLFRSSKPNSDMEWVDYVKGATVSITDDQGNKEVLVETANGFYSTSAAYQGVIGRSYQLSIRTAEGKEYQSSPQRMEPAGSIEGMYFEYHENEINPNNLDLPQDAIKVYINGKGEEGDPNLFRWRWRGTYEVKVFPQLKTTRQADGSILPDPMPCSGYEFNPVNGGIRRVSDCLCCDCWVTEFSPSAYVSKSSVDNTTFNGVFLAQLPIEAFRFYRKYYVEAEQLSVSEEVYEFWKLIEIQQRASGDLFQPNVVQVKGNVRSVNNPDEPVFGIFGVSAVATRTLFIDRNLDLPKPVEEIDTLIVDCRLYFDNSTNQKPPFW